MDAYHVAETMGTEDTLEAAGLVPPLILVMLAASRLVLSYRFCDRPRFGAELQYVPKRGMCSNAYHGVHCWGAEATPDSSRQVREMPRGTGIRRRRRCAAVVPVSPNHQLTLMQILVQVLRYAVDMIVRARATVLIES